MKKIVAFLVLLSLVNSADVFCQEVVRNLKGQVIEERKALVQSASIFLLNEDNNVILKAFTDSLGQFNLSCSLAGK